MVEGPGCKVKGEILKSKVKGQTVFKVLGNVIAKSKGKTSRSEIIGKEHNSGTIDTSTTKQVLTPYHVLNGQLINDVQMLGKELFIFFKDLEQCLRVHFLMSGTFRLNNKNEGGRLRFGESASPVFQLELTTVTLSFYKSAVHLRSAEECQNKIDKLQMLDICHDQFNQVKAAEMINNQQDQIISDVLLNQLILPGVGNIIKNEALFDIGIKPSSKVKELSPSHIRHLVKMTRDFSMLFYKCRRDGKSLHPYMKIYNKKTCGQCGSKVVTTRIGDDSARITSFCSNCQSNSLPSNTTKLSTKNSLLGWVNKMDDNSLPDWTCTQCTLTNKGCHTNCEVCFSPKVSEESGKVSGGKRKAIVKSDVYGEQNCKKSSVGHKSLRNISPQSTSVIRTLNKQPSSTQTASQLTPFKHSSFQQHDILNLNSENLETCITDDQLKLKLSPNNETIQHGSSSLFEAPKCPRHNVICIRRQVHKKGENHHRMFWTCSIKAQCNFFQWADENFPLCDSHGKRSVLRTVLKQGPNNGRRFYACPYNKAKQCKFFQWADV